MDGTEGFLKRKTMKLASDTKLDDTISMVCSDANTTSDTEEGEQCVECDIEEVAIPSHSEALDMLSECLPWVEQ